MLKKLLLISLIALSIIIGIILFFWFTKPIIPPYQSENQKETESLKFKKGIESGSPTHCVYSSDNVTTTYIISGNRSYVENTSKSINQPNTTITSYMLNTGNQIYLWNSTNGNGSVIEQKQEAASNVSQDSFNAHLNFPKNSNYKIRCLNTHRDESVFSPPANINFKPTTPRY